MMCELLELDHCLIKCYCYYNIIKCLMGSVGWGGKVPVVPSLQRSSEMQVLCSCAELFNYWKEWEKEGTSAERSQHTVHLEVSSTLSLSQPVCCPSPHITKPPSLCCLFFFFSASWFQGFSPSCMLQLLATVNFIPRTPWQQHLQRVMAIAIIFVDLTVCESYLFCIFMFTWNTFSIC